MVVGSTRWKNAETPGGNLGRGPLALPFDKDRQLRRGGLFGRDRENARFDPSTTKQEQNGDESRASCRII